MKDIRIRQLSFMGHVLRKRSGELGIDKIDGKRSRGRRWQMWITGVVEWIKERGVKNGDGVKTKQMTENFGTT